MKILIKKIAQKILGMLHFGAKNNSRPVYIVFVPITRISITSRLSGNENDILFLRKNSTYVLRRSFFQPLSLFCLAKLFHTFLSATLFLRTKIHFCTFPTCIWVRLLDHIPNGSVISIDIGFICCFVRYHVPNNVVICRDSGEMRFSTCFSFIFITSWAPWFYLRGDEKRR